MATPLDPNDFVTFKELLIANSIQVDALSQLLIEAGPITVQRFFQKLKAGTSPLSKETVPCLKDHPPTRNPRDHKQSMRLSTV